MKVPITKPYFTDDEKKAVLETLDSGWIVQGPKVAEFEKAFAKFQEATHAIATSSATAALHLALLALGIGEGDEVIVPSFTFPATANVVLYVGAKPIFVDIDLNTFNIDVEQIERVITKRTKAIMPVHLFGLPANMNPIMGLASKHNLFVIEDAACAHGAEYRGRKVGTIGHVGAFSFHPRKPITTGEGGMLTTNDSEIAKDAKIRRAHGENISDVERHGKSIVYPEFDRLGFNYRMTDIQAAIGINQMRKLNWIIKRKREFAYRYNKALRDIEFVIPPAEPKWAKHAFQAYVIRIADNSPFSRDDIALKLQEKGIMTRKGTYAVHNSVFYRKMLELKSDTFPNSLKAEEFSLALPLFPQMTTDELEYVIETLKNIFLS